MLELPCLQFWIWSWRSAMQNLSECENRSLRSFQISKAKSNHITNCLLRWETLLDCYWFFVTSFQDCRSQFLWCNGSVWELHTLSVVSKQSALLAIGQRAYGKCEGDTFFLVGFNQCHCLGCCWDTSNTHKL